MSDLPSLLITSIPLTIGAMLGAVGRAMTESLTAPQHERFSAARRWPAPWPLATFVVNIGGSFLLGLVTGLTVHFGGGFGSSPIVAALIGFTGGFSTFSTALVDAAKPAVTAGHGPYRTKTGERLELKHLLSALLHAFAMVGICLAAAALGMWIGKLV